MFFESKITDVFLSDIFSINFIHYFCTISDVYVVFSSKNLEFFLLSTSKTKAPVLLSTCLQ